MSYLKQGSYPRNISNKKKRKEEEGEGVTSGSQPGKTCLRNCVSYRPCGSSSQKGKGNDQLLAISGNRGGKITGDFFLPRKVQRNPSTCFPQGRKEKKAGTQGSISSGLGHVPKKYVTKWKQNSSKAQNEKKKKKSRGVLAPRKSFQKRECNGPRMGFWPTRKEKKGKIQKERNSRFSPGLQGKARRKDVFNPFSQEVRKKGFTDEESNGVYRHRRRWR